MSEKRANKKALRKAQMQIYKLTEDLRTMNINGINLYRCDDGSDDAIKYYQEVKKKKQEAHTENWHKKY